MTLNDLRKLFTGPTLFRLDLRIARRLMPILYALGLAALLLWAIRHLFSSFAMGFGDGLWGLLEILVFGLLGVVALRVGCEALLVYLRGHEEPVEDPSRGRIPSSLLEEVREAIRDLADEEEDADDGYFPTSVPTPTMPPPPPAAAMPPARPVTPAPAAPPAPKPATNAPASVSAPPPTPRKTPIRRTAKRTPRPKPEA